MVMEKQEAESGGIVIEPVEGEIPPPVTEEALQEEAIPEAPPGVRVAKEGKIPLEPAVIRLTFRIPGEMAAWKTGWPGWKLSEEDLADIVEVYEQLGIEAAPWVQALIIPVAAYGERFIGYMAWKRAGKPGGKEVIGAAPEEEPEGR